MPPQQLPPSFVSEDDEEEKLPASFVSEDTKPPMVSEVIPSALGKAWDWANTSIAGIESPSFQDFQTDPKGAVKNALGYGLTTPLAIGGELVGAGAAGIAGLRKMSRLAPLAEEMAEIPKPRISAIEAATNLKKSGQILPKIASETPEITALTDEAGRPIAPAKGNIVPPRPSGPWDANTNPKIVTPEGMPKISTAHDRVLQAIEESKPLNVKQAEINTAARAEKFEKAKNVDITDEESAKKFMSALAGEHDKVKFQPLNLPQEDVDELLATIGRSQLDVPRKAQAITGIRKLIAGNVPVPSEIEVLGKVFGPDMAEMLKGKAFLKEGPSKAREAYELSRGLMSVDPPFITSAAFRQALPMTGTKNWFKAWVPSAKAYGSEETYNTLQQNIASKPLFVPDVNTGKSYAQNIGLKMTDLYDLNSREEALRSTLAERIPIYGKHVRASNRAYTAFLNDLRANTLEDLIAHAKEAGLEPENNMVLGHQIADFINDATGRGSLRTSIGKKELSLEKHAKILTDTLFSPRLIARNVRMLNPSTYVMADPFVRKQYLKAAARTAAAWGTMSSLGALAGADVSLDPTNSDFGKIKIGNTRLDPGGGFQQYLVLFNRLLQGKYTSSTSGKETTLGEGFGSPDAGNIAIDFASNKLHPVLKFGYDMARASKGRPFPMGSRITEMFIPMIAGDLIELMKEDPNLIPLVLPASGVGIGSQTYGGGRQESMLPMDISIQGSPFNLSSYGVEQ